MLTDWITHISITSNSRDYTGNCELSGDTLMRVNTPYGYFDGTDYYSYLRDYQGNIRCVVRPAGRTDFEMVQQNHYYPYGLPVSCSVNPDANPYKYGSKHLDTRLIDVVALLRKDRLNLYDFEARLHTPDLARFLSPDPLAGIDHGVSPYVYCRANPIMNIDPLGLTDVYNPSSGKKQWIDDGINQVVELNDEQFENLESISFDSGHENYKNIINSGTVRPDLNPTVNNVLAGTDFVGYNSQKPDGCYGNACKQNNSTVAPSTQRIDTYNPPTVNDATEGSKYANEQLINGKSIVAGVQTVLNAKAKNVNTKTCHFINIVGQGFEIINGIPVNYFEYYDNATAYPHIGTDTNQNRLYQTGTTGAIQFIDTTNLIPFVNYGRAKFYRLTEIRRNR